METRVNVISSFKNLIPEALKCEAASTIITSHPKEDIMGPALRRYIIFKNMIAGNTPEHYLVGITLSCLPVDENRSEQDQETKSHLALNYLDLKTGAGLWIPFYEGDRQGMGYHNTKAVHTHQVVKVSNVRQTHDTFYNPLGYEFIENANMVVDFEATLVKMELAMSTRKVPTELMRQVDSWFAKNEYRGQKLDFHTEFLNAPRVSREIDKRLKSLRSLL